VGASVLALMFVLYLFANSAAARRSMHVALGLVLAGALGNLYDRTRHEAFVLHYDQPQRRVVGTLVKEEPGLYFIGDYPSGAGARAYRRDDVAEAGPEPVVRDFIKIEAKLGRFSLWPWIFNLADAYLVIGVGILLLHFWFEKKPAPIAADSQQPATT
jgi:lipoprotein signal peptidase